MSDDRPHLSSAALQELAFLACPRLDEAGSRAFVVRTVVRRATVPEAGGEPDPPGYRSEILALDPHAADPESTVRVVARGRAASGASDPHPSPDGSRLAYLAAPEADQPAQVFLLDLDRGGEPTRLTGTPGGVTELAWRPNGRSLAVLYKDAAAPKESTVVARAVEHLHAKEDGLPSPGLRTHARTRAGLVDAANDLDASAIAAGEEPPSDPHDPAVTGIRPLEIGEDEVQALAWAPDGATLWSFAPKNPERADAWRTTLWRLAIDDDGRPGPAEAFGELPFPSSHPVPSLDGATVAWAAPVDGDAFSHPSALIVTGTDRFAPQALTDPDLDLDPTPAGDARYGTMPTTPVALPGGGFLALSQRGGRSLPLRIEADGTVRTLRDAPEVAVAFSHAGSSTLLLCETPTRPARLVRLGSDGELHELHDPNRAFVDRYRPVDVQGPSLTPSGAEWWRYLPREPRDDGAIVLQVHGGPHTAAGYGFFFEFQLLARLGYAVAICNPRGSAGYGRAFADALLGRYGSVDADDVLAVADAALAAGGREDVPIHLTGGSYGGFMTNHLVTVTDRFRSAVTQRSICNWTSFFGSSDIGYRFTPHELGADPLSDPDKLWRQSPLARVGQVTTPILILHAEADHRCPVEQAEQWFVALKVAGRTHTRLVRFPGESHDLSRSGRPDRRIRRLREIVEWFEAHP